MKIICGIATTNDRSETLKHTVKSLINQVDELHIYNNSTNVDYADNAKFYQLQFIRKPVYYFCCDSDIIYPSDFVQNTIRLIEKYNAIITYHGRILVEPITKYYGNTHTVFDYRAELKTDKIVDCIGTGVAAFRTDYFNPTELFKSDFKRMSDLVFSLEAKRQGKILICAAHESNWIRAQHVESSIMKTEMAGNQINQINLAKQIVALRTN